ncbi:hypothetical protein QKT49_gp025 [Acanthamoeba castellanii medusavirus]|uniref:Uncharacterized protein n=1 Tax=Acanthamoeba castellanii medusavirus J1 TaxID=3114988 RepID=A0A3T1CWI6_9VIRU|nr:hypothetical protein QKT49_gp025 [Acanthamoeba castellanii medusavirus]BBI30165.1 hypothetical protein [Acanthamoeba castellanii medusavirus J1]
MNSFTTYLKSKGFTVPDNDEDYEPDIVEDYRGFEIGASCPNGGTTAVEILHDGQWYARFMEDEEGWDYSEEAFQELAHAVIDGWLPGNGDVIVC